MKREITNYQPIHHLGKDCGYLQTIETEGFKAVEIEYRLDEEFRGQGIMSNFLPCYLSELARRGFKNVTAHVEKTNHISKKLLEKNGFIKFGEIREYETFIRVAGLNVTPRDLERVREKIVKDF